MIPDPDTAYRALQTRDTRFDGQFFAAVKTTGIYCRPGCPARTAHRCNVEFYPTSAACQAAGYRACKRCLPEAAPGSPLWNLRADTVGAAMRLIGDGVVDREGVPGLARRLGYTPRHLGRLLTSELGASPMALARARRAHTARMLLTSTSMPISDIAFAAGFASIRQFNDTVREIFDTDPSSLRRRSRPGTQDTAAGTVTLRLPVRAPFATDALLAFLAARAVTGVEAVRDNSYHRTLRLPGGTGSVQMDFPAPGSEPATAAGRTHIDLTLTLDSLADLAPAVDRCRRLLDADADPLGIDLLLGADPALAASVAAHPGMRLPGAVDGFEIVLRALIGQQVSVPAARSTLGRIAATVDSVASRPRPAGSEDPDTGAGPDQALPWLLFPSAADVAALSPEQLGGPARRAATILAAASDIADGSLTVDPGRRSADLQRELVERKGFGPWTAGYIAMRVLGDPDVLLTSDLAVRQGAAALGLPDEPRALARRAEPFAPFRSYAGLHLWRAAASRPPIQTDPDPAEARRPEAAARRPKAS